MPTFKRCDPSVEKMANVLLSSYETHTPVKEAKVKIDFVFAYADLDDRGEPTGHAISHGGYPALGLCRVIPLKDRAMGRGDAEITIDHEFWEEANEQERMALLDHELHHISVKIDKRGFVTDDLHRPVIKLRKHDHQFGWFKEIAERHGMNSQECRQAAELFDVYGQAYWPGITGETARENRMQKLEVIGR